MNGIVAVYTFNENALQLVKRNIRCVNHDLIRFKEIRKFNWVHIKQKGSEGTFV